MYDFIINSFDFVYYIDCIGVTIPLLVFLFFWKKISFVGKNLVVGFYFIFWVGTLAASIPDSIYELKDNTWIYDLIPFFISFPLFFFYKKVIKSRFASRVNIISGIILLFFYLITFKNIFNGKLNVEYYLLFALFILINSVFYLYQELNQLQEIIVYKRIEFWFIASLFFYAGVCSLVWSFFYYVGTLPYEENTWRTGIMWPICHNTALFIQSLVFSLGMLWNVKKQL
jgi:hypothetical protein